MSPDFNEHDINELPTLDVQTKILKTSEQDFSEMTRNVFQIKRAPTPRNGLESAKRVSRSYGDLQFSMAEIKQNKRLKLLIVDDEPFNLVVLEGQLKLLEPRAIVHQAFNGKQAYDSLIDSIED